MNKKRKPKWIPISVISVLIVALIGGGIYYLKKTGTADTGTSTRTYQTQEVTQGEVSVDVSGSGTLSPAKSETITTQYTGTVTKVNKKVGDTVKSGETIAVISSDDLDSQIEAMETKIENLDVQIAGTDQTTSSKYITSTVNGVVKKIKAESGDLAEDVVDKYGYLCVISTDGKMQVSFTSSKTVKKYATVTVKVGSTEETGTVTAVDGKNVTVTIDENEYTIGKVVKIYNSSDKLLGKGKLALCDYVPINTTEGKISSVLVDDNDTVYKGTSLFKLTEYTENTTYQSLKTQKAELQEQLTELKQQKNVTVDFSGTIADIPIAVGDETGKDTTLCTVVAKKGFTLTVSVDELDIADLKLNDTAKITLDAIDGNYTGKVSYISNVGNTEESVTKYDVVITTEAIKGAYSGMNATATITTQSSGESLIVPVDAVQTASGSSFVYLAPDGSAKGDEVAQSTVTKDDLTKVTVKTGMSDGTNIVVISDKLAKGTLIYVPVVTTTEDSSSSSSSSSQSGMGQMGGGMSGQMPSGERPAGAPSGTTKSGN